MKKEIQVCPSCGGRFECGAKSGDCWCMSDSNLPRMPLPLSEDTAATCYCPSCLAGMREQRPAKAS